MGRRLGGALRDGAFGGGALALLLAAGLARGQVTAPRYQSPIEAPAPHLTLPTPPARSSPDAVVVEDEIVRVNDQIIDRSDVEREQAKLLEQARQGKASPAEIEEAEKNLLRDLIDQQLLLSRGKELDLNVDTDVVRQLDEIRKQNKLDAIEDKDCSATAKCTSLEKAVRESGISWEDFRADVKNGLIRQEVVRNEVARNLQRPTAKGEQAYLDQHKEEFEQPEQVRLSEILITTPENPTDAQIAQAQAKADEVVAKLKAGGKFEDLAKQYSGGPTADKGGDLGQPFKRGAMAQVFDDQTFKLPTGGITTPIRTRQGFVVLKVTEHIAAGVPALKDVEDQVQEAMFSSQMQPALRKYYTDLREKAYIDVQSGYVDTGASPNETKPVFAASTPVPVKKKVETQKGRIGTTLAPLPHAAVAPGAAASGAKPAVAGSTASTPAGTPAADATPSASASPAARVVNVAAGKKRKKIRREKVRFGQAPRNTLPAGPEETLAAGADQGAGATSVVLPESGAGLPAETQTNVALNADPLGPQVVARGKTRYSDRAATEAATKAAEKVTKVRQKALETPTPLSANEKVTQQVQDAALGLNGDTASKKKKKKVKGAEKERLQDQTPVPAAKPVATPLPPKSVRDNGEPLVSPAPAEKPVPAMPSTLPSSTAAPGAVIDPQPSTPANPVPVPPQQ